MESQIFGHDFGLFVINGIHSRAPPFTSHATPIIFFAAMNPFQVEVDPWGVDIDHFGIIGTEREIKQLLEQRSV